MINKFFFFLLTDTSSGLLNEIGLTVFISKSQSILCVSFSWTDTDQCISLLVGMVKLQSFAQFLVNFFSRISNVNSCTPCTNLFHSLIIVVDSLIKPTLSILLNIIYFKFKFTYFSYFFTPLVTSDFINMKKKIVSSKNMPCPKLYFNNVWIVKLFSPFFWCSCHYPSTHKVLCLIELW